MKNPAWLNTEHYPFKHHFIELPHGNMHYVDEGTGDPILFVHGTPTWSFLYRNLIKELSQTHRCIAIDHLGFGLSDKPRDFAGRPEDHSQNLTDFIQKLDLERITLVVHDFGGPIGLASAIRKHRRIERVVMFNTWPWETESNPAARRVDSIVNSWLGKFLYLNLNFSAKVLLKQGFSDRSKLTKEIHQHFVKTFPTNASRHGLLKLAQALVGSSAWYQQQWEQLAVLEHKLWLILWGTKDGFITLDHLEKWQKRLPNAETRLLECGHFVPEETETTSFIRAFLP